MNRGDVFLLPDAYGVHRNVILAVLPDGSFVSCHLTGRYAHSDTTCVIKAGEHISINKETVVRYDAAHHCSGEEAVAAFDRSISKRYEPMNEELFGRVFQGALDSPHTSDKIKEILRQNRPPAKVVIAKAAPPPRSRESR